MQFPQTQDITHIVRNRVWDIANYIAMSFCPISPEYVTEIMYDVLGASFGMTSAHNIGADPRTVNVPTMDTKRFGTGYWKETLPINEKELIEARQAGTFNQRAGRDLVVLRAIHLDTRLATRMEWLPWQVVQSGQIVVNENNVNYTLNYNIPASHKIDISGDADRKWSATDTSDPMSDIAEWLLLYRGTGARGVACYFNAGTALQLVKNAKFIDKLKQSNYVGLLSTEQVPKLLKLFFPSVDFIMYDGGYLDESKQFHTFIDDGRFIIRGEGMPGEKVMDFCSTISLHNGGLDKPQPGKFSIVEDESEKKKNPHIDLTVGIYGLPRLFHPDWFVTAKVF